MDGGTYPADIWGAYMKQASGKFCGQFAKPKTPFVSQPFMGYYSRQAGKGKDDKSDPNDPGATATPTPGTDDGARHQPDHRHQRRPTTKHQGAANGGTTFDPNQYETQPQAPPKTQSPGGGAQAPPGERTVNAGLTGV